jgi:hypothetical protein
VQLPLLLDQAHRRPLQHARHVLLLLGRGFGAGRLMLLHLRRPVTAVARRRCRRLGLLPGALVRQRHRTR